ncbi:Cysteine-rich receptor-like protein kinase 2 [Acorus calamus]|uniref:non-specific serine/threonine protein kinase n=1 Tax=Acorus calamus TaxID=4465 RepID=A0AAV9DKZ4_ACOCL|nr:Cysteine-rich receptor-like protein kinase 2 [Acorus calamus]
MSRALRMLLRTTGEPLLTPTNPPFTDEDTMEHREVEGDSHRLHENESSFIATLLHSTFYSRGYMAPECVVHGQFDRERMNKVSMKMTSALSKSSLNFKYSTLAKATGSFAVANKIGEGGFGTVYKGVLAGGREVVVKRLFMNNKHRVMDFFNEVNIINDQKGKEVDWEKMFKIIVRTARGLAYIHENLKARIIHRDIKASNVLLDAKLQAKIADFGLARSFDEDKSHISTAITGTS